MTSTDATSVFITYNNLDVIIGYRESNDEYLEEIITSSQTKFPDYKYLNLDANWSLGESYNYLIELAVGEYVLQLAVEHIARYGRKVSEGGDRL